MTWVTRELLGASEADDFERQMQPIADALGAGLRQVRSGAASLLEAVPPLPTPAPPLKLPSLDDLAGFKPPEPAAPAQPDGAPSWMPSLPSLPRLEDLFKPPEGQQQGGAAALPTAAGGTPAAMPSGGGGGEIDNSSRESFVRTAWPYLLAAANGDRNLAELMAAKAISENGSIGTGKPIFANNFSGIKGSGDAGSVEADTWEQTPNGPVTIRDRFAAYSTPQVGFAAFMQFLRDNSRYKDALARYQQTGDASGLLRDINAAGYATDPIWWQKVENIRASQVAPVVRGLGDAASSATATQAQPRPAPGALDTRSAPASVAPLATPNLGGPRRATHGIVVHSTRGQGRTPEDEYRKTLEWFANPASQVSAHAVIAADGTIAAVGDWDAQTWHAGENNADRIGVELVQSAADNDRGVPFTDAQYRSLAWLTGQLARRYGFAVSRDTLVGHEELEQGRRNGKTDPGRSFQWDRYVQEARAAAGRSASPNAASVVPPAAAAAPAPAPRPPAGPSGDVGSGDMRRVALSDAQPFPEDATAENRMLYQSGQPSEPKPVPVRNEEVWSPDDPAAPAYQAPMGRAGGGGVMQMYRQPLYPTDPEASTGAEYDPRDADSGPREAGYATPPVEYAASADDPGQATAPAPAPAYGRDTGVDYGPPAPAPEPESPLKPVWDAAGAVVGYVQERAAQTLGAAPSVASRAVERAAGPLVAAGNAAVEAYNDPLWQAAPAPARAIKIVSDTFSAYGEVAARQVAKELGVSDEELFSILGYPVSGQDIAGFVGAAALDPTNYAPIPSAGAIRRAAGPVAAAVLDPLGSAVGAAGRRVGQALDGNAARVAAADARMAAEGSTPTLGVMGPVPDPGEVRIPRAGYAADVSPGAERMVREASEADAPREVVRRAEVARKAEDVLGADPDAVQRWQQEALSEAPDARAVRGEALRRAEYVDAEHADRAIERLREAQRRVREAGDPEGLGADDRFDAADALLEAAEAARAFGISARASTAEGRAAARALNQRRSAITARQAFQSAERARQAASDAAFAARAVEQAAGTGRVTPDGAARLRILRDKLLEADRHGLVGDGAGGRLDALEARRAGPTTAAVRVGPQARPGVGLGTRVATDVGNAALGSGVGATAGAFAPADSDEERMANIRTGALVGAVGYPLVGRIVGRRGRGALAAFGPAPTPETPRRAVAVGADPSRRYEFRYRVADLRELIPSHLPSGAPNPAFPRELQPRARERVASQLQIDQIARGLEPDALLTDVGRLDSGPMIVGPDNIVESGNGRTLALQRAAAEYPERYAAYVDALRRDLGQYGLSEADLAGRELPVLVRERVSDVDRAAFAQEANNAGLLRMSSFEQAAQDAGNLSDDAVTGLQVGENDTIASALRRTENRDTVRRWVGTLPENERAGVLDAAGQLSAQGYERLTNALLVRTYGRGAGERLARAFIESADPTVRNVQAALMASLPDVARAEALIRAGARDAGLSIAEDVAAATEMLARLRRDGVPVREYLGQAAMFERELTPFQEDMLGFLDRNQRRQATIREALREYASVVDNSADPNQGAMFGGEVAAVSKEDAWRGATAAIEREQEAARAATRRARADGAGLAPASTEPVPEGFAPAGGPEGRLAVAGAPEQIARPGPVPEGMAPRGGPEGALAREGAPVPLAAPTQAQRGTLPVGGPEGTLAREGAPPGPSNLPAAGDFSTGGPEGTLTLASGRSIEDVAARIDEVLANPQAPGAPERLRELHADLQEISTQGFRRSSDIRRRLQRSGLLRAGLAAKDADVEPLVAALARVDPDRPEEMRAVLEVLSRPRLIDRLLEYQYVNMLSSPVTQAVNVSSNAMQIAGRLLFQNPLEFVYSGGRSTGAGAAFGGAARGFREGLAEAGQIMRTGTSSVELDRALELGDYGRVRREYLTERFGAAGAALHAISTRPLAAMDALLGHAAYASAAEQYAQRKADDLLRRGAESVRGMSREQARQHVLANIWDHPEIIERAGKIEDYTLLRSQDTEGGGWGRVERGLRMLAATRTPAEGAGLAGQATALLVNQVMPFFNVPLNAAKQGAERTVGVPVNAARALRAYGAGDVERGAELAAKATIGAAAVGAAVVLALGDNVTGDGPKDAGQRAIWELTHRRNSWRVPGTDTWLSWEGTPFAIPFGMVAGAAQGIRESTEQSARKGRVDPVDVAGAALLRGAQGAGQGFASQSFVRALGDQYQLLTGQQSGLSTVANQGASSVSRLVPASGMVNFFARVADDVERDTGRPQAASDLPEATGARIAARIPGTRQQLDPRLDAYGTPQERILPAPYYRGAGDRAGDPITRRVEDAGVGAIEVPSEVPAGVTEGVPIPLATPAERRAFQEAAGQTWRRLMEGNNVGAGGWSPQAIERLRAQARQAGVAAAIRAIPPEERQRRVRAALQRKAG